jgi:phosphoribosylformimino-5-aminoimidazole carboxamide ribotide isomerase
MPMKVVPVVDVKGGLAVHAVGGRRDQYQPLRSIWQATPLPEQLASASRDGLGLESLYLADLDAIEGRPPRFDLYRQLGALVPDLWIDAGLRDARDSDRFFDAALLNLNAVVGLESVSSPRDLADIAERMGADRTIFSLDLFEGRPRIAPGADWKADEPLAIARRAIRAGVRRLILLDLARVGTGRGTGTHRILAGLRQECPDVEISVGGGISGVEEILELRKAGATAVLVGSAIHDGRIGRRELERIAGAVRGV